MEVPVMSAANKIDVPSEHWDKLFAPSACLVMISTVDEAGVLWQATQ